MLLMQVPNTFFDLFLGYSAIWAILALFVIRMVRSQAQALKDIQSLKQHVDAQPDQTGKTEQ